MASYFCNGQQISYNIPVTNNGPNNATGVIVTVTVPTGLTFVSATVPTGTSYDDGTGVWTIGNLSVDQTLYLGLVFEISDANETPFVMGVAAAGNEAENIVINNTASDTKDRNCEQCYDGCNNGCGNCGCGCGNNGCAGCSGCGCCAPLPNTETPIAQPANVNNAGISGNVTAGDVPCNNCCATRYRLVAASEVNLDSVTLNEETGDYFVVLTDPTEVWSFQYEIYCVLCGGCDDTQEFGGFGPATVSGAGIFECDDVATCVNIEVNDTNSVDLTLAGDGTAATPFSLSADVIIDPDGTNVLVENVDGLFVPPGVAVAFTISDGSNTEDVLPGVDTLLFETGEGLQAVVSNPDTVTISFLDDPTTGGTDVQVYTFDDNTDTFTWQPIADIIPDPSCSIETFEVAAVDGDTINIAGILPADEDCIQVFRNGVRQFDSEDYSISGSAVTFVEPFGNSGGGTGGEIINIILP